MFINHLEKRRCLALIMTVVLTFSVLPLDVEADEVSSSDRIIVSLGDSYSSGEGIEPFYGQEEDNILVKIENQDWLAHRSQMAWPGMLTLENVDGSMSENRNTHWFFAASSGAKTKHLSKKQKKKVFKEGAVKVTHYWAEPIEKYVDPQLNIFKELGEKKADYVTLTLGGNDADFTGIITAVVLGHLGNSYLNLSYLPNKINATWEEFYKEGGIADDLLDSYQLISEKAGKQAHIIVAGYPKLLAATQYNVSENEAKTVNEAVSAFNKEINKLVETAQKDLGLNISFVSVEEKFEMHEAYSGEPYLNPLMFNIQSEDLNNSALSSAYSLHPNEVGASAYAECVQEEINRLEQERFGTKTSEAVNECVYEIIIEWDGRDGNNELINLDIELSGTLEDGSDIISDGTGQLFNSSGELVGIWTEELSAEKGKIFIELYDDGDFELSASDGNYSPVDSYSNVISSANAVAYVTVKNQNPVTFESTEGLIRSYTGFWFWGICGIHHGTVTEYDTSWIEENSKRIDIEVDPAVERRVNEIKDMYNEIQNSLTEYTMEDGGSDTIRYLDKLGRIRKIVTSETTYSGMNFNTEYSAEYFYDQNKVFFLVVYNQSEQHRIYLDKNDYLSCVRYIDEYGIIHDYPEGKHVNELTKVGNYVGLAMQELHWAGY